MVSSQPFLSLSCFVHIFLRLYSLSGEQYCRQVILLCLNDSKQASRSNHMCHSVLPVLLYFFSAGCPGESGASHLFGRTHFGLLFSPSLPVKEKEEQVELCFHYCHCVHCLSQLLATDDCNCWQQQYSSLECDLSHYLPIIFEEVDLGGGGGEGGGIGKKKQVPQNSVL